VIFEDKICIYQKKVVPLQREIYARAENIHIKS
jgi:hypothetical protein